MDINFSALLMPLLIASSTPPIKKYHLRSPSDDHKTYAGSYARVPLAEKIGEAVPERERVTKKRKLSHNPSTEVTPE